MAAHSSNLVLVGGGHAHLAVLADWIRHGLPFPEAVLLTPHRHLRYSGTVPGWIAGEYSQSDGLVDLAALAERAGAKIIFDRCKRIDPDASLIVTEDGDGVSFETASIDTGGVGRAAKLLGEDPRILDVRPIDQFVAQMADQWDGLDIKHLCVIGGGAGGVELAFGLRARLGEASQSRLTLIAGRDGILPGFSEAAQKLVRSELKRAKIELIAENAKLASGQLQAGNRNLEPVDLIVAALGSGAPEWPAASGLATDEAGFIAVDQFQRSLSHPHIYAVGDVASRQDRCVERSGVHAVHAGPVLAANLRAVAAGRAPRKSYTPRTASLYLLSTGNGSAIATYGPLAAKGRWASALKRWIDKRWLDRYARLSGEM